MKTKGIILFWHMLAALPILLFALWTVPAPASVPCAPVIEPPLSAVPAGFTGPGC